MHIKRFRSCFARYAVAACTAVSLVGGFSTTTFAAGNTVTHVTVHDPSIVKADNGAYYVFGSHRAFAKTSDLSNWSLFTNNINEGYKTLFAEGAKWSATNDAAYDVTGNTWAPDVIYNPVMKKWCLYMSVNGVDWNSSIALCTADQIEGPYTYAGTVVYSGFTEKTHPVEMTDYYKVCGEDADISRYLKDGKWNSQYGTNAIDPTVFYDADGKLWMTYGSWFGGLFLLELDETTGLRDYSVSYDLDNDAADGVAADPYLGIRIAGGLGASGEGSYIEKIDDYYYLFATYGGLDSNGGYNMRVFRAKDVTGPYVDVEGNYATYTKAVGASNTMGNVGVRLMSNYRWSCMDKAQLSQGHNSALTDEDGKYYVVYHTRFDDGTYTNNGAEYNNEMHEVRVHQMFLNEDGWLVVAPYEYRGEEISETGYSKDEVVGDYEFIVHRPDQPYLDGAQIGGYTYEIPVNISLNKDGSVNGSVNGTWEMKEGTPYMSFTYDGVTYKGVFLKQYQESEKAQEVMTFTAVGSNNVTIWGSAGKTTLTQSPSIYIADLEEGTYRFKNLNSKLYINVSNDSAEEGTNIDQWENNSETAQNFKLITDEDGYSALLTASSDYKSALTVEGGSPTDGTNVIEAPYIGDDSQKFMIANNGDGSYAILTKASNLTSALDVFNFSMENGGNVNQWSYWGGLCQKWIPEVVEETAPTFQVEVAHQMDNSIQPTFTITAEESIDLSEYTLRYYFTKTDMCEMAFWCDYSGKALNIAPWYVDLTSAVKGSFGEEDGKYYLDINLDNACTIDSKEDRITIQTRFANKDWSQIEGFKYEGYKIINNK